MDRHVANYIVGVYGVEGDTATTIDVIRLILASCQDVGSSVWAGSLAATSPPIGPLKSLSCEGRAEEVAREVSVASLIKVLRNMVIEFEGCE